jgi:putative ABC transport system substrate-binding protein
MKRRDFAFIVLGGAAVWPLRVRAQRSTNSMPRIGVLLPGTPTSFSVRTKAFLDALSKLGRVEGGTVKIEWKWANDRVDVLPELAAELSEAMLV